MMMGLKHGKWLSGGADVAIRVAFSLGMCGTLAGIVYVTARDGQADATSAQQTVRRTATVLASIDTRPQADRSQFAVDESPVFAPPATGAPGEVAMTPTERPVIPTKRPAAPIKPPVAKSEVVRFDRCLPACETHDPMIVGYANTMPERALQVSGVDEDIAQPVNSPVLSGASNLLEKALDAPSAVFRKSRAVIKTVVRATL